MRQRRILVLLLAVLVFVGMLAGCAKNNNTNNEVNENSSQNQKNDKQNGDEKNSQNSDEDNVNQATDNVVAYEDIVFPDSLPKIPIIAEDGMYDYSYDNMDEKYELEIFTHNYGVATLPADEDAVNIWLSEKFNLDITFTTVANNDAEQVLNTRLAAQDEPDIAYLKTRDAAFVLSDQGLLIDAKKIYPYMPHTQNYVTKTMIKWSENGNGELPFITKYGIQDGVWGFAIRQDWLDAFDMDIPSNKDELLAFAKACVEDDPDGNGEADTYFMTGAGSGKGWGMLDGFRNAFGNPSAYAAEGKLVDPIFDGAQKEFLMFLKELNDMDVLAPDWFTIEWESAKQYTMNDKIGMVRYPAGALYGEYTAAQEYSMESLDVWRFFEEYPIEGGKFMAAGYPGYMFGFTSKGFKDNEGKLKRAAHMLDTMVYGGENYFETIQGSTAEVLKNAGYEVKDDTTREFKYTDTNRFYIVKDMENYPWGKGDPADLLGPWQHFGLAVSWKVEAPTSDDPFKAKKAEVANKYSQYISQYDRWQPTDLLVTLTGDAAFAKTNMSEWVISKELEFVTGERSFDEWDQYTKEWLDKGGKDIIVQTAESLGVPVPDYAK